MMIRTAAHILAAACFAAPAVVLAQSSTVDEINRYRELLQDGNPADLWEARGEGLWKEKRGPRKASLERCDLGKGAGVVKALNVEEPGKFEVSTAEKLLEQAQKVTNFIP